MDSTVSYYDNVNLTPHFPGAITPWASPVLGASNISIARAPHAIKCGHYLLLKILLFLILPQLLHFSHLFVCVKYCVSMQFLLGF